MPVDVVGQLYSWKHAHVQTVIQLGTLGLWGWWGFNSFGVVRTRSDFSGLIYRLESFAT